MGDPASNWWWIGAGTAALVAFSLLALGWRGDRSRGRRRCPRCWYDMSGVESRRCPECGREPKTERRLFRTRRRRWALVLGLLLAICAGGLFATPRVLRDGWAKYAPTTVLIWMLPGFDDEEAPACEELRSRLELGWGSRRAERAPVDKLWGWQRSVLVNRCVRAIQQDSPAVATDVALRLLAQLGPDGSAAVPRLCELLESPPRYGISSVCGALASIGPASAPALPHLRETIAAYSTDWRATYSTQSALEVVARIGPEAAEALPEIRFVLDAAPPRQDDNDPRPHALRAAAALGPVAASAMPRILLLTTEAPHPVRLAALDAVAAIDPGLPGVRPSVLACLESPEIRLRDAAARVAAADTALLETAVGQAGEWLADAQTREDGLRCCISLGGSAAPLRPALVELALSDDAVTRWLCAAALAPHTADPAVGRALRALATDGDLRVRAAAAAAVRFGDQP